MKPRRGPRKMPLSTRPHGPRGKQPPDDTDEQIAELEEKSYCDVCGRELSLGEFVVCTEHEPEYHRRIGSDYYGSRPDSPGEAPGSLGSVDRNPARDPSDIPDRPAPDMRVAVEKLREYYDPSMVHPANDYAHVDIRVHVTMSDLPGAGLPDRFRANLQEEWPDIRPYSAYVDMHRAFLQSIADEYGASISMTTAVTSKAPIITPK